MTFFVRSAVINRFSIIYRQEFSMLLLYKIGAIYIGCNALKRIQNKAANCYVLRNMYFG